MMYLTGIIQKPNQSDNRLGVCVGKHEPIGNFNKNVFNISSCLWYLEKKGSKSLARWI